MKQFDFLSRKGRKHSPRKTLRQTFFFLAMLLGAFNSFAQTVLISPTVNNGGFESGTTGWTFVMETTSTTDANRWEIGGISTPFAGSNAAYITTGAAGVPYAYNTAPAVKRTAHMYRDVTFPAAETNITFNFQWKARGESGWDRLLVYIAPTSVTPVSGVPASNSTTFTGATLLWTQPTFTAASGSTYTQANVTITAAQAGNASLASTMRLIFVYQSDLSGGTNPPASVDNINLSTSCTGAAATTASSVTSSSATLNWTAFGGATGYNVRYKKVADPATVGTWATPTSVSGGSTVSLPVSSLTASTPYEYQVQATGPVCGVYSASSLFTTLCVSAPIPQNEGFNAAATIPTCWSTSIITTAGTPPAITFETAGSNPTSAPSEGARMAMFNSFNSNGGVIRLASLPVSTTGVSSVEVQFDWLHDNSNYTTSTYAGEGVQVQYSLDGINWVNHGAFIPRISTGTSTYWETKRIVFPSAVGNVGTVFVGFLFTSKYGNNCFMDNIKIRKEVTCFPPTAVNVTAPSSSGFTVNWTAPVQGTPLNYRYVVSTTNTTPTGAGTAVAGTSVPVTGLNPNTTYYIFVRTNCGSDSSDWTTATSFTTPCATALLPQNQGFNAATIPTCWSTSIITNSGTPPAITYETAGTNPTSTPYEGTYFVKFNSFNSNGGVIRLASLPVSTQCIPQAEVAFQWLHDNTNYTGTTYAGEGVQLQYSLNGTTWVDMGSFIPRNSTGTTAYWDPKTVQLPPAACNQATVYIGFKFTSLYGNNCYMDDVKIRQVQTCFPATAPAVSSVIHNSATFAWTAPTSGTPAGYEYVVSTTSTTPTGSGTSVTGTSVNVTSLNPSTTYYAFVRTNCGGCDFSGWAGPVTFTTSCAPVTLPYTQQFGASLPTCWSATEATAGASQHWATTTADATNGAAGPKSGTHFARLNVNGAAATYNPYYMNMGPVTLLNCNNTIAYYYFIGNNGSATPLSLEVSTSSTGPWTSLFAHTSANSTFATTNAVSNWTERIVDLNAYNGQTVYLRYASTSNAGTGIANQGLDSIRILPKKPTTTNASQCGAGTPNCSATSQTGVSSPSFRWYTVPTGGTAISGQTGATLSGYSISTTTQFYVSEVVSGVETERTQVTATVTSVTTINTHPSPVWICDGANAVFTCSAAGTGTITYEWQYSPGGTAPFVPLTNGGKYSGVSTNTLTVTGVTNAEIGAYRCRANSNCGPTNSNPGWLTVVPQPSVTITASTNTICAGQNITFNATAYDAGTPSYQWRRNNTNVGTNSTAYSSTALTNNDVIECIITSTANCPVKTKDTSNQQIITVNPLVPTSVTITSDWGTLGCVAVPVTFTATPVNPGGNPTYQWKRNGVNVGANSPVYKDSTMASGSIIRCEMASSIGCPNPANAVSNNITMTIIPVGFSTISVKPSPDSIGCEGATITFYSSFTNGGNNPRYQWMKNGTVLPNDTLATYTTSALADNDEVTVKFTSSQSCVFPITSAPVTMQLDAVVVPTATITGEPVGNGILFTASVTNGGTSPTLQWRKNNIDIPGATTSTFTASGLNLDDEISLWFVSDLMCAAPKAVSSNILTPLKVTGINNISQQFSDMSLFPNPNTGEFNLRGTLLNAVNNKEAKIEIMNALGQVVYKTSSLVSGKELDIKVNMGGSQAAGMYMLHIDIDGNKNSLRFVLK